jgi:hypothetical protein
MISSTLPNPSPRESSKPKLPDSKLMPMVHPTSKTLLMSKGKNQESNVNDILAGLLFIEYIYIHSKPNLY